MIMYKFILILGLVLVAQSVYTSKHFEKLGFNVKDGIFTKTKEVNDVIGTMCNKVQLKDQNFNYNGTVRTGYVRVNKGRSVLGFVFYGRENTPQNQIKNYPIVFWLNGGPGSSSQLGNFMQLGPYFIKGGHMKPYDIVKNPNAWTKEYNVIFVDQPVGTGLSYADDKAQNVYCTSMEQVANDFYYALGQLYKNNDGCFKQLNISPDQPFVIFGESYGGKYAPAIGQKIIRQQKDNNGFLTGLKGVAVGDGFTHPFDIFSQVGEFAYNLGLMDYQQRSRVQQVIMNATYQNRAQMWRDLHDSFDLVYDLIDQATGGINVYDMTKYHQYPDILIREFINSPQGRNLFKFHPDITFDAQAANVYEAMYEDFMKEYVHLIYNLLDRGVNLMIYNGQNDLIVQTPGTFKWVERVYYDKADQFRKTLLKPWKVKDKVAGYVKRVGKLQLRTLNNAGHLVPMDQGENALEMAKQFIKNSME